MLFKSISWVAQTNSELLTLAEHGAMDQVQACYTCPSLVPWSGATILCERSPWLTFVLPTCLSLHRRHEQSASKCCSCTVTQHIYAVPQNWTVDWQFSVPKHSFCP